MRIKVMPLLVCSFLIVGIGEAGLAGNLEGKLVVGAKGGVCRSMPEGLSFESDNNGNYGLGISVEYFFSEPLSGGVSFSHNSFEGEWISPAYYAMWNHHYYTDWSWSDVSVFGRFVLAPYEEVSPYFTAGMGLYIPRIRNKSYYHVPDTIYTDTFYGKTEFGYHFSFGIHCLLSKRTMIYLELPLTVIRDSDGSQYLNIFAGISFLFGDGKIKLIRRTGSR